MSSLSLQVSSVPSSTTIGNQEQKIFEDLMNLIHRGNLSGLDILLSKEPEASNIIIKHRYWNGNMAVHYASTLDNPDMIKALVKLGSDVNIKNDYGWTPLMISIYHNKMEVTNYLLSLNIPAQAGTCNEFGINPVICAITSNQLSTLRLILDETSNITRQEQLGLGPSALMIACHLGKTAIVSMLLQKGAECNSQCRLNGWTALMYAANRKSSIAIIKLLIETGADINLKSWAGMTAVQIASMQGNNDSVEYLKAISHNDDASGINVPSNTEVDIFGMLANEDYEGLKRLLENEPSIVDHRDMKNGFTPLIFAVVKGDLEAAQIILEYKADLQVVDNNGWTALKYASYKNYKTLVQPLVQKGAKIYFPVEREGDQVFIKNELALISNNPEIISVLMKAVSFIDENAVKIQGSASLHDSLNEDESWFSKLMGKKKKALQIAHSSAGSSTGIQKIPKIKLQRKSKNIPEIKNVEIDSLNLDTSSFSSKTRNSSVLKTDSPLSISPLSPVKRTGDDVNLKSRRTSSTSTSSKYNSTETIVPLATPETFLKSLGLEKYSEILKRKANTMVELINLTSSDLMSLRIDTHHQKILLYNFNVWKQQHVKVKPATVSVVDDLPKEIDKHKMINEMKRKKKENRESSGSENFIPGASHSSGVVKQL